MNCLGFYLKIALFDQINLCSNLGILALISYYPLHMKLFNYLMDDLKLEASP